MTPSAVLAPPSESQPIVRVCCHCRRVWAGDRWQEPPEPPPAVVTHGICRECFVAHYPEFPVPDELR